MMIIFKTYDGQTWALDANKPESSQAWHITAEIAKWVSNNLLAGNGTPVYQNFGADVIYVTRVMFSRPEPRPVDDITLVCRVANLGGQYYVDLTLQTSNDNAPELHAVISINLPTILSLFANRVESTHD